MLSVKITRSYWNGTSYIKLHTSGVFQSCSGKWKLWRDIKTIITELTTNWGNKMKRSFLDRHCGTGITSLKLTYPVASENRQSEKPIPSPSTSTKCKKNTMDGWQGPSSSNYWFPRAILLSRIHGAPNTHMSYLTPEISKKNQSNPLKRKKHRGNFNHPNGASSTCWHCFKKKHVFGAHGMVIPSWWFQTI